MNQTASTLTKNQRVDVRKRNLDTQKVLTIVRSREDLKKFENTYNYEDSKDDEVEKLTSLIHKKKFEILIPEIKAVAPNSEVGITQTIDSKKANNEESASTSFSNNGEIVSKSTTSSNVQGAGSSFKQQKGAAQNTAANQQSMITSNVEAYLNYKPIFKMPSHYIKFKETVYEGFENFSFNELNYEISDKDLKFLEHSSLEITHQDFEKVIDVFEKIVVIDQIQSLQHLTTRFYDKAPKEYAQRIQKITLEQIYQQYWKSEREKRKRSFLRMFWEKADYDDVDANSAFRKRQKEKMKLRKKTKYEIESYFKMFELRKDSINVLSILQNVWKREEIKKKMNLVDQAAFETQFEATLKERGIPYQPKVNKIDIKKLEINTKSGLSLNINENKIYGGPLSKYNEIPSDNKIKETKATRGAGYSISREVTPQKPDNAQSKTQMDMMESNQQQSQVSISHGRGGTITIKQPKQQNQPHIMHPPNTIQAQEQPQQNPDLTRDQVGKKTATRIRGLATKQNDKNNVPTKSEEQYSMPPIQQIKEDATCTFDAITMISMLLHYKGKLGFNIQERQLKFDYQSKKELKEKAESFFEKNKIDQEDEKMSGDNADESTMDQTFKSMGPYSRLNSTNKQIASKKSPEQVELEEEFEALLNRNFVIRRGRNNRILVKLIEKNIFEEENTYDIQDDGKPILRKRKKAYYSNALEYINRELPDLQRSSQYQLLRDKKFIFKKLRKSNTLSVKESVKRIIAKDQLQNQESNNFVGIPPNLQTMNSLIQQESSVNELKSATSFSNNPSLNFNNIPGGAQSAMNSNNSQDNQQMGEDSDDVVNFILSKNLGELLELAEGVGEFGEFEAHSDNPSQLEDFQKQQERALKLFKQQRMPMIGGGHNNQSSTNLMGAAAIGGSSLMGQQSQGQINQSNYPMQPSRMSSNSGANVPMNPNNVQNYQGRYQQQPGNNGYAPTGTSNGMSHQYQAVAAK